VRIRTFFCVGLGAVGSCAGDSSVVPSQPILAGVTAIANPHNALSARVALLTENVDSARIRIRGADGVEQHTPFRRLRGIDTLVVLGLASESDYTLVAEVWGGSVSLQSGAQAFRTGFLPAALQAVHLRGVGAPSAGHTLTVPVFLGGQNDGYVVAFDGSGRISWYRVIEGDGWAVEARQQPNGNISVYVGRSYGWQATAGGYLEFRPDGELVRRFAAAPAFYTDPHDLLLTFRDTTLESVHLIGYDIQSYPPDVTRDGRTTLAVHRILRQSPEGQVEFEWNAGDHFSPADWPASGVPFDLVHPSSLDIGRDGNYLVSLQALDEVAKVNARTGAILWRLGGRNSDFTFTGDPLGGFSGQHSVRELENGNLLMFDNRSGPDPLASRAVEYRLDQGAGTATMVWEYRPDPSITSRIMGSAQRLRGGNTVVGFGVAGRVIEVGAGSTPIWDATLTKDGDPLPMQFYRAVRLASLYRYERP